MLTISVRNVHQALVEGCHVMVQQSVERDSRNGKVKVLPYPLTTLYGKPKERVLFHPSRDANPFFHFFESLWMLAGRNDVEYVAQFAKSMADFSDDGKTLNGAYGHRWRERFGFDQLKRIARALKENPDCRRQVLAMWDGHTDLDHGKSVDIPCNTQAYFQRGTEGELHMMVTNRSNDLVWGAYGANAVHFSVLQEYMAGMIGCEVGGYWQTSMNTHVYERHFDLMSELALQAADGFTLRGSPYDNNSVEPLPLMSIQAGRWNRELDTWFKRGVEGNYDDPTFSGVAVPMMLAWGCHKARDYGHARVLCSSIEASDWSRACNEWIQRREAKWTAKNA